MIIEGNQTVKVEIEPIYILKELRKKSIPGYTTYSVGDSDRYIGEDGFWYRESYDPRDGTTFHHKGKEASGKEKELESAFKVLFMHFEDKK